MIVDREPAADADGRPSDSRLLDPSSRMQVYFQGLLDDACFVYAQANAYKALTGRRVTRAHWRSAVARLPEPAAFLGGAGATELAPGDALDLIEMILANFGDPGEWFTVEQLDASAGLVDLSANVTRDSVVVFAYGGSTEFMRPASHIVCGVAASDDGSTLHTACSAAFWTRFFESGDYSERHHQDLGRWSNDSIAADHQVVVSPNFRWRITHARSSADETSR